MSKIQPIKAVSVTTTALTHRGPQVIQPGVQAEQLKRANQPKPKPTKADRFIDTNKVVFQRGYPTQSK